MNVKEKWNNGILPNLLALKAGETWEREGRTSYSCQADGDTIYICHFGYVNDEANHQSWYYVGRCSKKNLEPIQ